MTVRQATLRGVLFVVLICGAAWLALPRRTVHFPPGILLPDEPLQTEFTRPQQPITSGDWSLVPLANLAIEGRLLAKERYRNDSVSSLSPWDLALGWGKMSDEAVLERLDVVQENRVYHWNYWGEPPIPEKDIVTHSANVHVIPANDAIRKSIGSLPVGALVRLEGWLVEATHPKAGRPWRSSLLRDDEGEGACEILYVRYFTEMAR